MWTRWFSESVPQRATSYWRHQVFKYKNSYSSNVFHFNPLFLHVVYTAAYPAWTHWFSDNIPQRTTPQDRRKAREERDAERQRLLQQQREEERRKDMEELVKKK